MTRRREFPPGPAEAETVVELDLLAYADRRLEDDPARRLAVERYLSQHPEQAERVASFRAQNEALLRAGAPRLEEPVPQRLLDALDRERPATARLTARAAAVAALVAVSAAGGWLAGTGGSTGDSGAEAFAAGALLDYRQHSPGGGTSTAGSAMGAAVEGRPAPTGEGSGPAVAGAGVLPANDLDSQALSQQGLAPTNWLRRRIAVEIEPPDLGAEGFSLVETRRVELSGEAALRLIYRRGDGRRATLYLRPRWKQGANTLGRTERGGLTVLHWLDGPLAVALVTDGTDGEMTEALASRIRGTLAQPELVEPSAQPAVSQDARLTGPAAGQSLRPLGEALPARPDSPL
jgi:anti-sigma factor RsiW